MSLSPKFWGKYFWKTMHIITVSYPLHPSKNDMNAFKNLIESMKYLLPCDECSSNLKKKLQFFCLTDDILQNKANLILWLHTLHNMVNAHTGKNIVSFENAMINLCSDKEANDQIYDEQNSNHEQHSDHEHNYEYKNIKRFTEVELINTSEIIEKMNKTIQEKNKIDQEFKELDSKMDKYFSQEKIDKIKQKETEFREKIKRDQEKLNYGELLSYQTEINVKYMIDKINEVANNDEKNKHDILIFLNMLLECF